MRLGVNVIHSEMNLIPLNTIHPYLQSPSEVQWKKSETTFHDKHTHCNSFRQNDIALSETRVFGINI